LGPEFAPDRFKLEDIAGVNPTLLSPGAICHPVC
jgi:hypothetical protein